MRIGLKAANQQFAKTIKAVRAGQQVVLTDRGQPIAIITPIKNEDTDQERVLQAMAAEGLITLPDRKGPMPTPDWQPMKVKRAPASRTIVGNREETV